MKKTVLIIILLVINSNVFCQSKETKIEEFFNEIQCKKTIENSFNEIDKLLIENKEELFSKYELDFENKADVYDFENFVKSEIDVFKHVTYVSISHKYTKSYSEKQIQKFINLAKNKKSKKNARIKSNFKIELDSIIENAKENLQNDVHLKLTKMKAKYKPLILNIFENGRQINISKIDLHFILNTNDKQNPQLSILNEKSAEISLPTNFDFQTVTSLTIKINEEIFKIERYIKNLPETLREISSNLRKDSFNDLEFWTLNINEENISLKMQNEVIIRR